MRSQEPQTAPGSSDRQQTLANTLLAFGVASFIGVLVMEVVYWNMARLSGAWQYNALLVNNSALALVILLNVFLLVRLKNPTLSAWIFIGTVNLTFPIASLFASGVGIIFATASFIFTAIFALQALPRRSIQVTVAVSLGAVFSMVNLVIEFVINPTNRIPVDLQIQQLAVIVIGAVVLFLGMHLISQFEYRSMRIQFNLTYLLAVIVPALMIGIPSIMRTQDLLTDNSYKTLQNSATQTSTQIEKFFQEHLASIQADATLPSVIGFLQGEETSEEAFGTLLALGSSQSEIKSHFILDANGIGIFDTGEDQTHTGRDESAAPYFTNVASNYLPYASEVLFDQQSGEAEIYFSAAVLGDEGEFLGVLVVEYDASVLQNLLLTSNAALNDFTDVILADENHTILASTAAPIVVYKNVAPLTVGQVADLQVSRRLPPGPVEDILLDVPDLDAGLSNPSSTLFTLELEEDDQTPGDDQASLIVMQNKPWIVIAAEPGEVLLQPLYAQLRESGLLFLFLFIGAGFISNLAARMLVAPLQRLTTLAGQTQAGNLSARSGIQRSDEIGILAQAMDQTTSQLAATLRDLEQRVAERTYDLEISRLQSEERSRNLVAISEVARAISAEQRLDVLLPLVTRTVSEKFDFYHVGIFLLDPTRTYAVLQAANSEGGKRMLARGHRLEVGQIGIVGYVAETSLPRIALDVGTDAAFFNNPDLPETHSEMALPLIVRGEVIGVLDVQSVKHGAFTENDASILGTMADQIAIAIENARLFERTQNALNEVQSMYSQYLRQEWKRFAQQLTMSGYHQAIGGGRLLNKPVQNREIQQALDRGEVVVLEQQSDSRPTIVVPVKLRNETLGVLYIVSLQKERRWAREEVALVQTASDRLALALENARLLQDSLSRAERERKVSEITSHIRSTNDPNEMIRLAVHELKNALGVNRVEILPQSVTDRPGPK